MGPRLQVHAVALSLHLCLLRWDLLPSFCLKSALNAAICYALGSFLWEKIWLCLASQPLPWGCDWTMVRLPAVVSFWSCKKHPSRRWCQGWTKERGFENQDHGSHQLRTSEESIPGDGVSWGNGVKWPECFSLEAFQILQHQERVELCCKPLCPKTFPSSYFPNFCENKITSLWQSVVKI